jgi:hypothetical protein
MVQDKLDAGPYRSRILLAQGQIQCLSVQCRRLFPLYGVAMAVSRVAGPHSKAGLYSND